MTFVSNAAERRIIAHIDQKMAAYERASDFKMLVGLLLIALLLVVVQPHPRVALALAAPIDQPLPVMSTRPAPAPTPMIVARAPTAVPTPMAVLITPTPVQNGLPDNLYDWRGVMTLYYMPSPAQFWGYVTRYGSDQRAIMELWWYSREAHDEMDVLGIVLDGGNFGFYDDVLIGNRTDYARALGSGQKLTIPTPNENQRRILAWSQLKYEDFAQTVLKKYAGVISLKSNNDIGREYCLYRGIGFGLVGRTVVGGSAANNDWTPFGQSVNDNLGHARLGVRLWRDDSGQAWHWAADLPDNLFKVAGGSDRPVLIFLYEPGADEICPERMKG